MEFWTKGKMRVLVDARCMDVQNPWLGTGESTCFESEEDEYMKGTRSAIAPQPPLIPSSKFHKRSHVTMRRFRAQIVSQEWDIETVSVANGVPKEFEES